MNKGKVGAPFEYPHSKKTYFIRIFGSCNSIQLNMLKRNTSI